MVQLWTKETRFLIFLKVNDPCLNITINGVWLKCNTEWRVIKPKCWGYSGGGEKAMLNCKDGSSSIWHQERETESGQSADHWQCIKDAINELCGPPTVTAGLGWGSQLGTGEPLPMSGQVGRGVRSWEGLVFGGGKEQEEERTEFGKVPVRHVPLRDSILSQVCP